MALGKKGVAAIGYQTIQSHLTYKYGYGGVKIWVDPDKEKIRWLATDRRQANHTRSGYVDRGPAIEPPLLVPAIEGDPKPRLLEVADLYAYVAAQAHLNKGGWKNKWFQDLYKVIDPERLTLIPNPNPRWENA